jgi:hypothetical protein
MNKNNEYRIVKGDSQYMMLFDSRIILNQDISIHAKGLYVLIEALSTKYGEGFEIQLLYDNITIRKKLLYELLKELEQHGIINLRTGE